MNKPLLRESRYKPGDRVYLSTDEMDVWDPVTLTTSYRRKTQGKPGHYYMQTWWRTAEGYRFTEDCIVERADG